MDTTDTKQRKDGYNAKRIREILGVKQEDLAERLGLSQRTVSKLEQTDVLKDEQLTAIAKALNVPVEAIKNYSDDSAANFVNTFYDNSSFNYQCSFNPVDKIVELFERLLKAEHEKIALLQEVLKERKSIDKDSKEIEKEANQFASEFLMPINECKNELLNMKYHELNTLKVYWKISKAAILYKAEDFNCLKPSTIKSYRFRLINDGERTQEKIIVNIDEPRIIKQILNAYREQLHYTEEELSQLTGMNTSDIAELLEYRADRKIISLFA